MWMISFVMLFVVFCLAGMAMYAPTYHDNLGQRAGLFALVLGCASEMTALSAFMYVHPRDMLMHLGVFLFAIGTAAKVIYFCRRHRMTA